MENRFQEVLDAIQVFSNAVDKRFSETDGRIEELHTEIALVRADVGILNHKLDRMDIRVTRLETA